MSDSNVSPFTLFLTYERTDYAEMEKNIRQFVFPLLNEEKRIRLYRNERSFCCLYRLTRRTTRHDSLVNEIFIY